VFVFHLNTNKDAVKKSESSGYQTFPSKVRPPALEGKRVGVFATTHRPAPAGLSLLKKDIKPFVPHYDSVGFHPLNIPKDLNVPNWVASGLEKRRDVMI